jgi:type IV pilus secretin PilQ/predicted competence protein
MKHTQPLIAWWLIILISFAMTLQGCSAKTPGPQGPVVTLTKIEPHEADGRTEITVEGTGPILQYTSFQLTEPLRLVVDIADAEVGNFKNKIEMKSGAITDITPAQKDNIARLEIGLSQAVDTKVYQADGKLMIEVVKPVEEAKPAAETAVPAQPQEAPIPEQVEATEVYPAATVVSSVKATAGKKGARVVITGDGALMAKILKLGGNRIAINIPGTRSKVRHKLIPVRKGGLLRVRVGQHTDKVSVVLDLSKPMDYTVTPEGKSLVIALGPAGVRKEEKAPQELAAAQEPQLPVIEKETAAPVEPTVTSQETTTAPPAEKEVVPQEAAPVVSQPVKKERVAAAKPAAGIADNTLLAGGSRYAGRKISLDLQDADLINVMRLFAEVANLNIILSPEVKGKVTVRMVNIPWDQAMEIILKMNGLGYVLDDNILRIATLGALTKEADEELRAKESKKKAEDLITRIIPINYSTASTIESTIKKSLSSRGDTVVDARTNTLIVKDIARAVDDVVALIKILDKPIAQIMIEARIVEASLSFSRQIGVQWGGNSSFDAAHGNPTGLNFPNSVGITGGNSMGGTPSGNGNFLVNNPAAAGASTGGGAIGFQFGSISKALNLDIVLSALESTGEGRVISSPRISALDNKEAKIEQGLSIPFSTTSSSGTQIQFIDAKLALTVTPHATPDNRVFLKIQATKNAPDTSILGASGQPSIRKNEATTEILLGDGETAVIGGILTTERSVGYTKVPFFGDLPFIGWLFRSKTNVEKKGELLIFITPRVVRQEVI